jgi:hypothetical protein
VHIAVAERLLTARRMDEHDAIKSPERAAAFELVDPGTLGGRDGAADRH